MAIDGFIKQAGDAFVDRLGPKAQTLAIGKEQVQAEYRAMTTRLTTDAQGELAQYMQQRFAEPENRWLFAVLEMAMPPPSSAPAANAARAPQLSPQVRAAIDAIDGATQLPASDRAKLKSLVLAGADGRDVAVKIEAGKRGGVSIHIGARGGKLALAGGAGAGLAAHVDRFARGADDRAKWEGSGDYVFNRLTLGFEQLDLGGLRGYEAAQIAGDRTASHIDGANLEAVLKIDIPDSSGRLPEGASVLKIKDQPHTTHRGDIGALVTTQFGWSTAANMAAGASQDVLFTDGHVASAVFESGAGMRGVFTWPK